LKEFTELALEKTADGRYMAVWKEDTEKKPGIAGNFMERS